MFKLSPRMQSLLDYHPLLIVSDYDGTLAPFTAQPGEAYPQPRAWEAFNRLSTLPGVMIALLTGRDRAGILELTNFAYPEAVVGGHGVELPGAELSLTNAENALYHAVQERLQALAESAEGAFVEVKPLSLALHTRQCPPAIDKALNADAQKLLDLYPQLHFTQGKNIAEFSVRFSNKGDGLAWLIHESQAQAAVFLGDDTTDEHGFRWLRENMPQNSYSLRVGPGETYANDRVDTIDDIADFLQAIYQSSIADTE